MSDFRLSVVLSSDLEHLQWMAEMHHLGPSEISHRFHKLFSDYLRSADPAERDYLTTNFTRWESQVRNFSRSE